MSNEFLIYKNEIELLYAQNPVEFELYSIVAPLIRLRKSSDEYSVRDMSARRTTQLSKRFKSGAGFPDFVVLENVTSKEAKIYGAIEIKRINAKLDNEYNITQLNSHIETFGKVIHTNALKWSFYSNNQKPSWTISIGEIDQNKFIWHDNNWNELLDKLNAIVWGIK